MSSSNHSNDDLSDEIILNQENVLSYGFIAFTLSLITIFALAQAGKTTINFTLGENAYNMLQEEKKNLKNYTFEFKFNKKETNKQEKNNKEKNNLHDNHEH